MCIKRNHNNIEKIVIITNTFTLETTTSTHGSITLVAFQKFKHP